ncbi:MAG: hypothetical protein SGILL_007746 [Bacillariaceae sp.]
MENAVEVTMEEVSAVVADGEKVSTTSTTMPQLITADDRDSSLTKRRCRLRQSVATKRMSLALTVSEQKFVDHLLEHGQDSDLRAMDINLSNSVVFKEKDEDEAQALQNNADRNSVASGCRNNTNQVLGSTRRQEYLKSRMSCSQSKSTSRKQATLKGMSANSISGAAAVAAAFAKQEGASCSDGDDEDDDEVHISTITDSNQHAPSQMKSSMRSTGRMSAMTLESLQSLAECFDEDDQESSCDENDGGQPSSHAKNNQQEEKKEDDEDEEIESIRAKDSNDYFHPDDTTADEEDSAFASRLSSISSMIRKNKADAAIFNSRRGGRPELVKTASINMYHGEGFEVGKLDAFELYSPDNHYMEHYDPWMFSEVDEDGLSRTDNFHILGTSRDDKSAQPHVLSPILMQSLQEHLPRSNRGESFWLKYSLVRDGASTISFLQHLRGSRHTMLVCETVDGDVFGFFGTQPWVVQPSYFGSGESFVWRMHHSRILENGEEYHAGNMGEQVEREAEIEVYPALTHTGNRFYQLCQHDKIAVGGGVCSTPQDFGKSETPEIYQPEDIGFALVFDDESLLHGTTSACMTFQSPPLAKSNGMTYLCNLIGFPFRNIVLTLLLHCIANLVQWMEEEWSLSMWKYGVSRPV